MADVETPERNGQLYAEDLIPGLQFQGKAVVLSAEHFSGFARLTGDAHPLHYDDAYAAQTRFKRPIGHGLLLMAMTALGATAMSQRLEGAMIAFLEQGARFLRPVFVGDRVRAQFTVDTVDMKPDKGIIRFSVRLQNEAEETLLDGHHTYMIRRRASVANSPASRGAET